MNEKEKVEMRLNKMKSFYKKAENLIDELPDIIPKDKKEMIKEMIFGDTTLKDLMDGVDSNRPPRIFLIGRTGVGKSSLINAIMGEYLAQVSDVKSCTQNAQVYKCVKGENELFHIFDTRGIAESESLDKENAENALITEVQHFSPDVAIMMLDCTHRDDIVSDVEFMKKLAKQYGETNKVELPVIVVVNKCDEVAPARIKEPNEYTQNKLKTIEEVVQYYNNVVVNNGLYIKEIIAVSSYIDWKTKNGLEVSVKDIESMTNDEIKDLEICFDGRYNIEKLIDLLIDAIQDSGAQMGFRMAARLDGVTGRIANELITVFSGLSATVALSPIPVSDIYILVLLQCVLVALIASLSGRDIDLDSAKEFIISAGGVTGLGYTFRMIAQQGSKLVNAVAPGAGSVISSGVAATGTGAIGKAAVSYYLDDLKNDDSKKQRK